ncbi:MAG: hypothetical protein KF746_14025 [Chitinophagaceae bacterium]|nr:hypothetical protein [Chitinophagaceae bacterium]
MKKKQLIAAELPVAAPAGISIPQNLIFIVTHLKIMLLFLFVMSLTSFAMAQSPAGKWKITGWYTESMTGKKTNVFEEFAKSDPCFAKIILSFTANGKITGQGAEKCPRTVTERSPGTRWEMPAKNKIRVFASDTDREPETFDLEIKGNKMHWIRTWPNDLDIGDGDKEIRRFILEFIRA